MYFLHNNLTSKPLKRARQGSDVSAFFTTNPEMGRSKADRKSDANIAAVHRLFSVLEIGAHKVLVKLAVKEVSQVDRANRLYTVEAVDINVENPAAQWVGEIVQLDEVDPRTIRSAGDVYTLAEFVEKTIPKSNNYYRIATRLEARLCLKQHY